MYSEEAEELRKDLLDIRWQISKIEKNHRLEDREKEEASLRLEELKKAEEDIRFKLRHQMFLDCEKQNRGGRV